MMNATYKILLTTSLAVLLASCDEVYKPTDGPSDQVAYISEFLGSESTSFTVDKMGGYGTITPRISGLIDEGTTFTVEVDQSILDAYNAKNKTSFKVLPDANFDFELAEGAGSVSDSGNKATVNVPAAQVDNVLTVRVHSMLEGGVMPAAEEAGESAEGEEQAPETEELPTYNNYAIPVRLTSTTTGRIQENASTGIIFLNRKFEAGAYYAQSGALTMVYKTEDPSFTDDPDFSSWTYQVFIKIGPTANFSNYGLVYPNYRDRGEDWGYTCFYGPSSPTFFMPEGKFTFNQKEFADFEFKRNQWYNIAATFGKNEKGITEFKFYVNGKLAFSQPTAGTSQGWQKPIIGNQAFTGWVRDWRLWNRALSIGEINETMWSVNPESEGLMMYLPLDKDFKNVVPGHEEDWQLVKAGNGYHFKDKFPFPMEID